jgi:inorganic phosphate transporter, PiT family
MTLLVLVLAAALVFEYINGFHDTANAIATVVSTKVLTPRLASPGRPAGTWSAPFPAPPSPTIAKGLVDTNASRPTVLFARSSRPSHGGSSPGGSACPPARPMPLSAAFAARPRGLGGNWGVLRWSTGLWPKVVLPMFSSPVIGFASAACC